MAFPGGIHLSCRCEFRGNDEHSKGNQFQHLRLGVAVTQRAVIDDLRASMQFAFRDCKTVPRSRVWAEEHCTWMVRFRRRIPF